MESIYHNDLERHCCRDFDRQVAVRSLIVINLRDENMISATIYRVMPFNVFDALGYGYRVEFAAVIVGSVGSLSACLT